MDTISLESVVWAYRLFLDREPHDERDVEEKKGIVNSTSALRSLFLDSDEYKTKNADNLFNAMSGHEPEMQVDLNPPEASLARLFDHIQSTWRSLGETQPLWSVLSLDEYRGEEEAATDAFYASGSTTTLQLLHTLKRNGIDLDSLHTCLEFGCGLGRVTNWLSEHFNQVYAYDISSSHLAQAKDLQSEKHRNIEWLQLHVLDDLNNLKPADLIYSIIVLQHNPPPLIGRTIEALLKTLNKGGVAVFQVPTYRMGYQFDTDQYLNGNDQDLNDYGDDIEMHFFPQREVFEIVRREQCVILEVLEDAHIGFHYHDRSNTFVVLKPASRYVDRFLRYKSD